MDKINCLKCNKEIPSDSVTCPHCKEKLTIECPKCKKNIPERSLICPYCKYNLDDNSGSGETGGGDGGGGGGYLKYGGAEKCHAVLEALKKASDFMQGANFYLGEVAGVDTSVDLKSVFAAAGEEDYKFDLDGYKHSSGSEARNEEGKRILIIPGSFGSENLASLDRSIGGSISLCLNTSKLIGGHFASIKSLEKISANYGALEDWFNDLYINKDALGETVGTSIGENDACLTRSNFAEKYREELATQLKNSSLKDPNIDMAAFDDIVNNYLSSAEGDKEVKGKMMVDLSIIGYVDIYGTNLAGLNHLLNNAQDMVGATLSTLLIGYEDQGKQSIYDFRNNIGLTTYNIPSIIFGGINAITGNLDLKYINKLAEFDATINSSLVSSRRKAQATAEKRDYIKEKSKENPDYHSNDTEKVENALNSILEKATESATEVRDGLKNELSTLYLGITDTPAVEATGVLISELLDSSTKGEVITKPTKEYMESRGILYKQDQELVLDYYSIIEKGYNKRIFDLNLQIESYKNITKGIGSILFDQNRLRLAKNLDFSEKSQSINIVYDGLVSSYFDKNAVFSGTYDDPNTFLSVNEILPISLVEQNGETYVQNKETGEFILASDFNWLSLHQSVNSYASNHNWDSYQKHCINNAISRMMNTVFKDVGFSRNGGNSTIPNIIGYLDDEFLKHASPTEMKELAYIVNTENTENALKYIDQIRSTINTRIGDLRGQRVAEFIDNTLLENVKNYLLDLERKSNLFATINLSKVADDAITYVDSLKDVTYEDGVIKKMFSDKFLSIIDGAEVVRDFESIMLYGLGTGVEGFFEGMENFFGGVDGVKSIREVEVEYVSNYLNNGFLLNAEGNYDGINKALAKIATASFEISSSIGNMIPTILASALVSLATGGVGGAPVAAILMGMSSAGNACESAFQNGADYNDAVLYGVISGTMEAAFEYILGGITGMAKGTGFFTKEAATSLGKKTAEEAAKDFMKEMFKEGREEFLQEIMDSFLQAGILGEDLNIDLGQALKAGIYGAISAGLMNGGTLIVKNTANKITETFKISELTSAFTAQEFDLINNYDLCNTPEQLSYIYQAAKYLNAGKYAEYNAIMQELILKSSDPTIDVSADYKSNSLHDSIYKKYDIKGDHDSKLLDEGVRSASTALEVSEGGPWVLLKRQNSNFFALSPGKIINDVTVDASVKDSVIYDGDINVRSEQVDIIQESVSNIEEKQTTTDSAFAPAISNKENSVIGIEAPAQDIKKETIDVKVTEQQTANENASAIATTGAVVFSGPTFGSAANVVSGIGVTTTMKEAPVTTSKTIFSQQATPQQQNISVEAVAQKQNVSQEASNQEQSASQEAIVQEQNVSQQMVSPKSDFSLYLKQQFGIDATKLSPVEMVAVNYELSVNGLDNIKSMDFEQYKEFAVEQYHGATNPYSKVNYTNFGNMAVQDVLNTFQTDSDSFFDRLGIKYDPDYIAYTKYMLKNGELDSIVKNFDSVESVLEYVAANGEWFMSERADFNDVLDGKTTEVSKSTFDYASFYIANMLETKTYLNPIECHKALDIVEKIYNPFITDSNADLSLGQEVYKNILEMQQEAKSDLIDQAAEAMLETKTSVQSVKESAIREQSESAYLDETAARQEETYAYNYGNSLVGKILDGMPANLNIVEKARYLYLELGQAVSYSDYYFLQLNSNFGNPLLAQEFYYMNVDPAKVTANTELICRQWSELYRDALIKAGVDPKIIKLNGNTAVDETGRVLLDANGEPLFKNGTHVVVEIFFQDGLKIVADPTNVYSGSSDLYKIKNGMPDVGFVITQDSVNTKDLTAAWTGKMEEQRKNSAGLLNDIDQKLKPNLSPESMLSPETINTINEHFGETGVYQTFAVPGLNPQTVEVDNTFLNLHRLQTRNGLNTYIYARDMIAKMKPFSRGVDVDLSLYLKADNATHTTQNMLYFTVRNVGTNVTNNYVFSIDGKIELIEDISSYENDGWVRIIDGETHHSRNQNVENAIEEDLRDTLDLSEVVDEVKKTEVTKEVYKDTTDLSEVVADVAKPEVPSEIAPTIDLSEVIADVTKAEEVPSELSINEQNQNIATDNDKNSANIRQNTTVEVLDTKSNPNILNNGKLGAEMAKSHLKVISEQKTKFLQAIEYDDSVAKLANDTYLKSMPEGVIIDYDSPKAVQISIGDIVATQHAKYGSHNINEIFISAHRLDIEHFFSNPEYYEKIGQSIESYSKHGNDQPIKLFKNSDGTYTLVDGNNRVTLMYMQYLSEIAHANGDITIITEINNRYKIYAEVVGEIVSPNNNQASLINKTEQSIVQSDQSTIQNDQSVTRVDQSIDSNVSYSKTYDRVMEIIKVIDMKHKTDPVKYVSGIETLEAYLNKGNINYITSAENCRVDIASIPKETLRTILGEINSVDSKIKYIVETIDLKFQQSPEGRVKGIETLQLYLDTGNINYITSTNNCRNLIASIPKDQVSAALERIKNSSQPVMVNKKQGHFNNHSGSNQQVNANNFESPLFNQIANPIKDPQVLSFVEQAVNNAIVNNSDSYRELVKSSIRKSLPTKRNIKKFYQHFSDKYYRIITQPGKSFDHVQSSDYNYYEDENKIVSRLYVNMGNMNDVIDFSIDFADRCKQLGIPVYFKTTYMRDGAENISDIQLTRDEAVVIYINENEKYLHDYIAICDEIKKTMGADKFLKPPKLTGSINGYLGYGKEPSIGGNSYNGVRANLLEEATRQANNNLMNYYNIHDLSQLLNYLRQDSLRYSNYLNVIYSYVQKLAPSFRVDPYSFFKNSGGK